jgi:ribosome biogenesis GTPase
MPTSISGLERYLAAAWQSGARPIVVLTKADVCDDPQVRTAEAKASRGAVRFLFRPR